jgi:NAD(P)-dependent dehydrogenase (short-subunit alcohol dehydrogenase family)
MVQPGSSGTRKASFRGKTTGKEEIMNNGNSKTAIIAGGSRGLGRNTVVNLTRRGVDLIFTYHSNAAEGQSLVREVEAIGRKAVAFQLDAGNISLFDRFVDDARNRLRSWGARAVRLPGEQCRDFLAQAVRSNNGSRIRTKSSTCISKAFISSTRNSFR